MSLCFISGRITAILKKSVVSLIISDEDIDYDFIDDPDYEHEYFEEDYHSSDSDVTLESGDDSVENDDENNLRFFIGKDGETLWSNNAVSTRLKINSKNIVKIFSGPKVIVRQCKTPLECFLQIITSEMITNIVKYTNIFIIKKLSENQLSRERLQINKSSRNNGTFRCSLFDCSKKRKSLQCFRILD